MPHLPGPLASIKFRMAHTHLRVANIVTAAEHVYNLPKGAIVSQRRDDKALIARQLAMLLGTELLGRSTGEVGLYIDRDHTTVIQGRRTAVRRLIRTPATHVHATEVWDLANELAAKSVAAPESTRPQPARAVPKVDDKPVRFNPTTYRFRERGIDCAWTKEDLIYMTYRFESAFERAISGMDYSTGAAP